MDMKVVGAVSRAGEKHSVLFCEYTGSRGEDDLIDSFLTGLKVAFDRKSIYCLAVRSEDETTGEVVGIYYCKGGVECMLYDRPYEYLNGYVSEMFSEELQHILKKGETRDDDTKAN